MAHETVATDPLVRRRGLPRAQHDALAVTGTLGGERVELLERVVVEVVPQGEQHHWAILRLDRWLTEPGPAGCAVVRRLPGGTSRSWGRTAELSVLGVPVDLTALLPC